MSDPHPTLAWLLALAPGAALLHTPSGVVGNLASFWEPGTYTDPEGNTLDAHVLRFDTGDIFIAAPENFVALDQAEREFFARVTAELRKVIGTAVGIAKVLSSTSTLTLPRALLLVRSALAVQLRELARGD